MRINLKTSRAWEFKTTFESCRAQRDRQAGRELLTKWKKRAVRSRLPVPAKLAKSLAASLPELLNYFTHRISNAMSE